MMSTLRNPFGIALLAISLGACDAAPSEPPPAASVPPVIASVGPDAGQGLTYDALLAVIADPDDFAKARKLGELLPTLGPEGVPAVKEVMKHAAVLEMGAAEFELLMRYWALHDPEAASIYAYMEAPRGYKVAAIHATLRPWARQDPQGALGWAAGWTMAPGDAGAAAAIAFVRGWYESGKPGLEQYIHDLGVGFERQRALGVYATAMIQKDGSAAVVDWAEALPDTDQAYKLDVYRKVANSLVPFDLQAAMDFCQAHCEGPYGDSVRSYIADRWVRLDPPRAFEWLSKAPPGPETDFAVRISYATWAVDDRDAAVAWMTDQLSHADEAPAWLKPTLPIYARRLAEDSPLEGLAWATKLDDENEREVVTVEIAHNWRQRDEAAAEEWLSHSSLSEESLRKVRDTSRTWRGNQSDGASG